MDSAGYRVKDGERLSLELTFASLRSLGTLEIFQEDCKAAGVEIVLVQKSPMEAWLSVRSRKFEIASQAWGSLLYPNPGTMYSGALAKETDNNNISAFADEDVDKLIARYEDEYSPAKRAQIMRKIDGIIFEAHPYILGWYSPALRVIHANKFSMPDWGVTRFADASDMTHTWWVDPEMAAAYEAALADETLTLLTEPEQHRFWDEWDR